jgi:acetoin utilization protein AcuC
MCGHGLPDALRRDPTLPLPADWRTRWQQESPVPLPAAWLDPVNDWEPMPRRNEITSRNKVVKELAMIYLPRS